jgi:hypothetical protein
MEWWKRLLYKLSTMVSASYVDIDRVLGDLVMQLMNTCTPNLFPPLPQPEFPLPWLFKLLGPMERPEP